MKSIVLCAQYHEDRVLYINDPITAGSGTIIFPRDVVVRSITFGSNFFDEEGRMVPHFFQVAFTSFSNILSPPAGSTVNPVLDRMALVTNDVNSFRDIYVELTGHRELFFQLSYVPLIENVILTPYDMNYSCVVSYEELEFKRGRFVDNEPSVTKFNREEYEHY